MSSVRADVGGIEARIGGREPGVGPVHDVAPHVEVREQGAVLRHVAHVAPMGREVDPARCVSASTSPPTDTAPLRGTRSPAMTSSSDVFPLPDGP